MKINASILPLYAAFVVEVLFFSILKKRLPPLINPLFVTGISLFIVVYAFRIWQKNKEDIPHHVASPLNSALLLKAGSIAAALITLILFWLFFASEPIDISQSDIIPCIQKYYLDRLLSGEDVYALVTDYGPSPWIPNYFPMHWLPLTLSAILHFDHRVMAMTILLLVILYYSFRIINRSNSSVNAIIRIALPYSILVCMRFDERIILGHTVETMICAYYFLFVLTIIGGNTILKSIGLSSILLSRFSLILWTPFYVVSSFLVNKKKTVTLIAICITMALFLFIIPFQRWNPLLIIRSITQFNDVYIQEWSGQGWQKPGDMPYQLFQGMGFACYFYKFWPGDLMARLNAIQAMQLAVNLVALILSFAFMKRLSNKIGMEKYQLLTLKVCLILFYSFVVVPYQYLFMVPLFVSAAIVSQFSLFIKTPETDGKALKHME